MPSELETFRVLGEALAIGLLVGVERYRGRGPGEKKAAGVRTFALFALLGAVCGILDETLLTGITFTAVAALVLAGYARSPAEALGMTTEFAALLVFWLGFLLRTHELPAISLGIVLTIFLASKRPLHDFVKERISEAEFEATLKFLAVVLVVYPVLPDQAMGPLGFFNPRQVWGLVILVSTLSYAGYFLIRWLGPRRGLGVASLAGGVVSTTAVTMSLADRARQHPEASRLCGVVAVVANAVQGPRLLLLLWVVDRELARTLLVPLLGMAAVGLAGGWLLSRRLRGGEDLRFPLQNPYSLAPALKFGLFFVAVLLVVRLAGQALGDRGFLLASALAGTGSASAALLSLAQLTGKSALAGPVAAAAALIAVAANAAAKFLLALVNGTRPMALWLGGGLLTMVATGFALLYLGAGH